MSRTPNCCDLALCEAATRIEALHDAEPDPDARMALRQAHKAVMQPVGERFLADYTSLMERAWLDDDQTGDETAG